MRILIVINTSWNIYNYRKGLIKSLLAKGCEVIAVAPPDKYSAELEKLGCTFVPVNMDNKGINPLKDIVLLFRLFLLYRKLKPDVVLHYTIKPNVYGSIACGLCGIRCISNVSGLGTVFIRKGWLLLAAKMLYASAFRLPQRVFFQNSEDRELFLLHKLVKEHKTGLLPGSGIDVASYIPQTRSTAAAGPFRFLLIARLLEDKGIREYAQASRLLQQAGYAFEAQLVGFFDRESRFNISSDEIKIWEKEGLIRFLGESSDIRTQIAASNCVVLPSYREGTPRSLLEAMAMAKPIVTTNVPGCREVIEQNRNGFLCEVKDARSLANAMEKMMQLAPEDRNRMGAEGRRLAEEKFDEQIVVEKYFEEIFLQ